MAVAYSRPYCLCIAIELQRSGSSFVVIGHEIGFSVEILGNIHPVKAGSRACKTILGSLTSDSDPLNFILK